MPYASVFLREFQCEIFSVVLILMLTKEFVYLRFSLVFFLQRILDAFFTSLWTIFGEHISFIECRMKVGLIILLCG